MTQESQEVRTIKLQREVQFSSIRLLEFVGITSWAIGFAIIGFAVVTAYMTPARIVEYSGPNGALTIQGVEFRQILLGFFLMGFRTVLHGALWLKNEVKERLNPSIPLAAR